MLLEVGSCDRYRHSSLKSDFKNNRGTETTAFPLLLHSRSFLLFFRRQSSSSSTSSSSSCTHKSEGELMLGYYDIIHDEEKAKLFKSFRSNSMLKVYARIHSHEGVYTQCVWKLPTVCAYVPQCRNTMEAHHESNNEVLI